jgi:hypothetical protein
MNSALQAAPIMPYRPFTSESARIAGAKGAARQKELRDLAKAHKLVSEPARPGLSTHAAVTQYRRTQRRMLLQACNTQSSSEALEWVRAASMVFEMECVLTGRKATIGKAGKPPGKLAADSELPMPLEMPPSDLPPLDPSTLPPKGYDPDAQAQAP